ncbi:unnamed protein product [Dovyalis caffra]|uniref:Haloacid dehalogenase-like hydrolase superfamily protein n=1 Tax=Dovyalis caffra TaxID=77055 RepID=A0AAV1RWM2_9ROSI|nr:unnamed protein product [Dovyalis caffra]
MQEAIGAEYGEGFETFRQDGLLKVDVDFLNDRLQEGFLHRIRYAMKPDEAYGLVFSWDNVVTCIALVLWREWNTCMHAKDLSAHGDQRKQDVIWDFEIKEYGQYSDSNAGILEREKGRRGADTRSIKLNVWKQLAIEEGKEIPEDDRAKRLMLYADADHILHKGLLWETEDSEVDRLKLRLSQLYHDNLLGLREPIEGLEEWLDAVSRVHIPCAVVSCLDRINMVGALERMGLKKYFQAIVSEEDGMESIAHRFLSAAMKLDRKPSKCVVFEDDPRGIAAAHNCTMMAVALIGAHPAYDLVQADLAVASFNELSVINLRRLFANKGSTFMDRQKEIAEKSPPKRKLTVDTLY